MCTEIRHAAALTATHIISTKEQAISTEQEKVQQRQVRIAELCELAKFLGGAKWLQLKEQINQLLTQQEGAIHTELYILPKEMHTNELVDVFNQYLQASVILSDAIRASNNVLGLSEQNRLGEDQLVSKAEEDAQFEASAEYIALTAAIEGTNTANDAFNNYCCSEEMYKNYLIHYYKKNQWFAFQRQYAGEQST